MTNKQSSLPGPIRSALSGLRQRIRAYVVLEGLMLAAIWLAVTFWCGLALDYLPVFVGASELPRAARVVLLAIIAVVTAYILFKWVFARTLAKLSDRSLAVLLERRFDEFHDSLVTTVELNEAPDHASDFNSDMLGITDAEALERVKNVNVGKVFRWGPLGWKLALACLLIIPIVVFGATNKQVLATWLKRGYLLSDEKWERYAQIEVPGIELLPNVSLEGELAAPKFIPFEESRSIKVARGSSIRLMVRANPEKKKMPERCVVTYTTSDNDRGSVIVNEYREDREGWRVFSYDAKPFQGILSALTFDVRGYDHRVRDYHIEVVESPVVESWTVHCDYPEYLGKLPLEGVPLQPKGSSFARGSNIILFGNTNKPISQVTITRPQTDSSDAGESTTIEVDGEESFGFGIDNLLTDSVLEFTLVDTDGLVSERPQRVTLGATIDTAPRVDTFLKGIGSAVTPDVKIPFQGTISDDNGVAETTVKIYKNDAEPRDFDFTLKPRGEIETEVDFQAERLIEGGVELKEKDKLTVMVTATDNYKLGEEGPNVSTSDKYELNVVTPAELLRLLEYEELGLRRRFELIVGDVQEMKDSLVRVQDELDALTGDADSTDETESAIDPEDEETKIDPVKKAEQARRLRLLRVQRGLLASQKSASETLGVATAFEDIRLELINNRIVEAGDRKERWQEAIATPLRNVAEEMFPELDKYLVDLQDQLEDPEKGGESARVVVDQANAIVVEMETVLDAMLKMEGYNDLLKIVRGILKDQEELIDATDDERKNQLIGDLIKPKK